MAAARGRRKVKKDDVDLVDVAQVAELLQVKAQTVHQWRSKGRIVEPDWTFGGVPVWLRDTIVDWAKENGRMDEQGRPVKRVNHVVNPQRD